MIATDTATDTATAPAVDIGFAEHLARVKAATTGGYSLVSIPEWIQENTFLQGEHFSFKDHEFQLTILRDQSREKVIRKCSQVGISEMSVRLALAIVNVIDSSTIIYTLPTANFAKKFAKTRFDTVISTSPALRRSVNVTADNTEVKQFNDSFIFIGGTVGQTAAISVPADGVFHDEVDFSDAQVMSNYQSRLKHSKHKLKVKLSTPTVEGYGISGEFSNSRRHWNFVCCEHCGERFVPDYFKHVRIPGYDGDIREVTKSVLPKLKYQLAYVECPKCHKAPSLQPEHREWVCENPDDNYVAAGYQIQPFDAPNVINCQMLIESSVAYARYVDFVNFELGLPAEDKESTLSRVELENCFFRGEVSGGFARIAGIDMGSICHIFIGDVDSMGRITVIKSERIPLSRFQERKRELFAQYRVGLSVMDSLPYTETLLQMQKTDPNLYGAIYVNSQDIAPYKVKKVDEEDAVEGGELQERQVNVNRNKALDALMNFVRSGNLAILEDDNKEVIIAHMTDMKRVKDFTKDNEIAYMWRKSASANDHFHHAMLYLYVASLMRPVYNAGIILPGYLSTFKHKLS